MKHAQFKADVAFCCRLGLNVAIPLIIGGITYILFRPDTMLSKIIYSLIGKEIYARIYLSSSFIITIMRNYLADFMWALALSYVLMYIAQKNCKSSFWYFSYCMVAIFIMEISIGTFDVWDLIVEFIASYINYLRRLKIYQIREKEGKYGQHK